MRLIPDSEKTKAAPRSASFFGGDVIVTGPHGYCIDPASVQRGGGAGFALMASCAHMGSAAGSIPDGDVPPAVVTVSVLARDGRAQQPSARRLAAPWANAGVIRQIDGDGISLIQLERGGDTQLPGGDARHWRGAMLINGHVIGLAAYGEAGSGVAEKAGYDILVDVAGAMLDASPVRRAMPPAPRPEPVQTTARETAGDTPARTAVRQRGNTPQRGLKSMMSGLFRNPA